RVFGGFKELGLSDEVLEALEEMGISVPTEIQGVGIPEVIEGKSVVLGSHTGRVLGGFKELGLSDEVLEALEEEMGISVPAKIQGVGIPEVIQGKSVVLGSHMGSGKTLAQLLPLVQVFVFGLICVSLICYAI
ncbi:DEAD-box ATP-dependent RNA helicase 39, partial [Tanacetum coccineum]